MALDHQKGDEAAIILEPDGFPLAPDSPYAEVQPLVSDYIKYAPEPQDRYYGNDPKGCEAGRTILKSSLQTQALIVGAVVDRLWWAKQHETSHYSCLKKEETRNRAVLWALLDALLRRRLPLLEHDILHAMNTLGRYFISPSTWIRHIANHAEAHGLSENLRRKLETLRDTAQSFQRDERRRCEAAIDNLLGKTMIDQLQSGEAWADALRADVAALDEKSYAAWSEFITHCAASTAGQPSAKWLQRAKELLPDSNQFSTRLEKYLRLFVSQKEASYDRNLDIFKGLVWCAPFAETSDLRNALGDALPSCFKIGVLRREFDTGEEIINYGTTAPRAPRVGNAIIWALSQMNSLDAVAQLSRARLKVRHGGALKQIERALSAIATRLEVSPDELEELAVPDFGLENGALQQAFGEWMAHIDFASGKGEWTWQSEGKKPPKAVPTSVKKEHATAFKELKAQVGEIEKLLPAHKERLDLLLREEKTWPVEVWRERYLEHPFLELLARRVIWEWNTDNQTWHAFLPQETWISPSGKVESPPDGAQIRLWHPIRHAVDEVLSWRRLLEEKGIRQPFKQAHREVYLITEAELQTHTYSNRFAAHIIRQHQFNALCATRGWKNRLRLMVDDVAPPATKELPRYNLRAEFWVEGIGDDYGTDTNETGTFLRLATDQVRFYRLDAPENLAHVAGGGYGAGYRQAPAEPVPLVEVPPLIFSEVMRDVDLFVGVASVGNDPTWNDGGPQGQFRNYWQDYSFGDLSETAKTRRDLLTRLLPKLKIAALCELEGRFLRVKGKLRTYKIHLGSGNILMEPNDQYLCIVPSRETRGETLFLPFEGDQTLSVILSKAFLLAADDKITDPTITQQIQ